MTLTVGIKGDFTPKEVSDVIREALMYSERVAKYKIKKYSDVCNIFEKKYGMDSALFMDKFDSGKLGDNDDFFDWYAAKRGFDIWNKKLKVIL
jgi:transposase-like protein